MPEDTDNNGGGDRIAELMGKFETVIEGAVKKIGTATTQQPEPKPETKEAPKVYTRAELAALVSEGTITQAQADTISDDQTARKAVNTAKAELRGEQASANIVAELSKYKEKVTGLTDRESEVYKRVNAEYQRLVREMGFPDGSGATELVALKAVLGPADRLGGKAGSRFVEPFSEGGGSGGGGGGDADTDTGGSGMPADLAKTLTPRERQFYTAKIEKGIYPNWDAVKKEVGFRNADVARRAQARA